MPRFFHLLTVVALLAFGPAAMAELAPSVQPVLATVSLAPLSAQAVNAAAKGAVFRLSTHLEKANSRARHGTAFAVDSAGLLITNFHVVRDVMLGGKEYRLVLEAPEGAVAATVVAVDIVNDLALVRAGRTFDEVLRIAGHGGASEGEVVYSMGFPANEQLTFAQGNYGGEKPVGFVTSGFATMPLNSGMSGGPMLNSRAEVIGVNRAMVVNAQNLSFFSPLNALKSLISGNIDAGRTLASTSSNWKGEAVQAVKRQESSVLGSLSSAKRERLGDVSFSVPLPNQHCGQSKMGKRSEAKESELFVCRSSSLTPLVGESNALEVVTVGMVTDRPLMKIASPVQRALSEMYASEREEIIGVKKRGLASLESKPASRENCGLKNVLNANGVDMTVSYCSLANSVYEGLFSTFVRIEVRGKGAAATSLVQMYQGMSSQATADMLGRFLESLKMESGS